MATLNHIVPCLWFNNEAEEAARFYVGIFPNSRIRAITRYPAAGKEVHGREAGSVMTVEFELNGNRFTALNGGPHFKFTEAISLMVNCQTQQEVDHYWDTLSAGSSTWPSESTTGVLIEVVIVMIVPPSGARVEPPDPG